MLKIQRDKDGVAENNHKGLRMDTMSGLQDEIVDFVTKEEIVPVLTVIDVMVARGYWVEAVKEVLLKSFAAKGVLKHYVHGDDQDCNVIVSYDTLVTKPNVGHLMDRLEKDYRETIIDRTCGKF